MFLQLQRSLPILVICTSLLYVETKEELMTSLGKLGSPSQQSLSLVGSISSMRVDQPKLKLIALCYKCHHSD